MNREEIAKELMLEHKKDALQYIYGDQETIWLDIADYVLAEIEKAYKDGCEHGSKCH